MRERDKNGSPLNNKQTKRSNREERKESGLHFIKDIKNLNKEEVKSKTSLSRTSSTALVSNLNPNADSSNSYEGIVVHYMDEMDRSEESVMDAKDRSEETIMDAKDRSDEVIADAKASEMVAKESGEDREDPSSEGCKEGESDCEMAKDSVSSQGESQIVNENKAERASRVPKKLTKKLITESGPRDRQGTTSLQFKPTAKKSQKGDSKILDNKSKNMKVHAKPSSESSEGSEDKASEEMKEIDLTDELPNHGQDFGTDDETASTEENGADEDKVIDKQKIEEMELRIEKLEEELREVAALEISLYSVVPEHGSSAHKVHTPARRLSRFYIHACKHWSQVKRATIARNTVSGLVLIAKSCGNDVARLTFWWSNTIVLREIISQAFGSSHHSSLNGGRASESNGGGKRSEGKLPVNWKANGSSKKGKVAGFMQFVDDWQETSTFTVALEKIESWIFSRIVESVWWQTLTPHMQSPTGTVYTKNTYGRLLGPSLGDQQQGKFSIDLWKSAFQDAFQRLCPVRAEGHECGCLPVLARMVMEQCVARLDVAMFNAILRESMHEIPTDPVSDPIVDSKVLPIPAGNLSFGSGAQLKNSIGNWSRYLTDLFGMDADNSLNEDQINGKDDSRQEGEAESKSFCLLNAMSDLLMLPKDMVVDRSIRKEVCPTLGLSIITRILCNFTPDEFSPDPVPGTVLEALSYEGFLERRLSDKDLICSFPCTAPPVLYYPPSLADVAEKVELGDVGGSPQLWRNISVVQRKGYTSDDELDELDSPLTSIIDKSSTPRVNGGNGNHKDMVLQSNTSERYELLREVWSV